MPVTKELLLGLLESDPYYYVLSVADSYVKHRLGENYEDVGKAIIAYGVDVSMIPVLVEYMRNVLKGTPVDNDPELPRPIKRRRLNRLGEDVYLMPDKSIIRDEDKIIAAQRIFHHEYYKPGGRGYYAAMQRFHEKK
jgi:hypothetical protein